MAGDDDRDIDIRLLRTGRDYDGSLRSRPSETSGQGLWTVLLRREDDNVPTDFAALDAMAPLPADELFRQWLLTEDADLIPDAFECRAHGIWHLGAHVDAHVCDLVAPDGSKLGWIIEPLVQLTGTSGSAPRGEIHLDVPADPTAAEIEAALYGRDAGGRSSGAGLEGMWVAIVFGGPPRASFHRVYLGAIHSVVFSTEQRIVATSHNLIPQLRRDDHLSRAFDPLATKSYFTFGLTAFHGIRRLLPNHYLDLDSFHASRHWPLDRLEPLEEAQQGVEAVVDHGRRVLRQLAAENSRFRVFLSAGRDSRAVLAMIAPLTDEGLADVRLSTTTSRDLGRRIDLQAAKRLARIADLPIEIKHRPPHDADQPAVMRAFVRIGEAKAGSALSKPGMDVESRGQDDRLALAGMGGETARAFYWDRPDAQGRRRPPGVVTPELLVERTGSPLTAEACEAADRWLQTLPAALRADSASTLDLVYLEQRLGCWESTSRYLWPGRPRVWSPMTAAYNLETMLRLPEPYRGQGLLQRDMVAYGWPELLRAPFNRPTGLLGARWKAARLPRRVRRRIGRLSRRLVGSSRS